MARKSRTYRSALTSRFATHRVLRVPVRSFRPLGAVSFGPVQDGRAFHPLGPFRPVTASRRAGARLVIRNSRASFRRPEILGFAIPRHVRICAQRKERREVLFAKRKTGAGSRSPKTRNMWSAISCR